MEITIRSKNMVVTPELRAYIERKLSRAQRHLPQLDEVSIELSHEPTRAAERRYTVQITLNSRGTWLRAETRAPHTQAALDSALDVLSRQIERYKGKAYLSQRRAPSPLKEPPPPTPETGKVVRVKKFPVKPMSPEEAIEQMELLGHDFFLFFNPDSDQFNVLYRRSNGDYGLIEPELD